MVGFSWLPSRQPWIEYRARAPYCWIMPSVFTTQILSFSSL